MDEIIIYTLPIKQSLEDPNEHTRMSEINDGKQNKSTHLIRNQRFFNIALNRAFHIPTPITSAINLLNNWW